MNPMNTLQIIIHTVLAFLLAFFCISIITAIMASRQRHQRRQRLIRRATRSIR